MTSLRLLNSTGADRWVPWVYFLFSYTVRWNTISVRKNYKGRNSSKHRTHLSIQLSISGPGIVLTLKSYNSHNPSGSSSKGHERQGGWRRVPNPTWSNQGGHPGGGKAWAVFHEGNNLNKKTKAKKQCDVFKGTKRNWCFRSMKWDGELREKAGCGFLGCIREGLYPGCGDWRWGLWRVTGVIRFIF